VRYQILVVEDQPEIRTIVEKYLIKEGYAVLTASDGLEALAIFNSNTVHLVLLDVMMPGIDGFEVLKEIRTVSEVR
jgi:DNA-binding response OmpR family regulator